MKRRDALKNIGLAAGFAVITPNIFGMLQGCSSDKESWTPSFFNSDEHSLVSSIIDVFLPKTTETPSASEVKVTEFMDTYIHQILNEKDQQITRSGFHNVISILTSNGSSIESVTTEAYKKLLEDFLGTKVLFKKNKNKTKISFTLNSKEDLDSFIKKIS